MKKVYYFFVKAGKVLFIWMILVVVSISMYSFTIKGKVNYGDRCYQNFDDTIIKNYTYENVTLLEGYLECNTYYLRYDSKLEEDKNILFLVSLSKLLYENQINCNIHIIVESQEYQLFATIVDYKVSYSKTLI